MATKEVRKAHNTIIGGVKNLDKRMEGISRQQAVQLAAQTPIAMLQGIQPPYFYGDEGEDVEAFIYALVNCASANDWKDNKTVSNLAHFLDGRAGYAFRAAVKHRVDRAQGSQKEALEKKRKAREKLEQLRTEKEEASAELQSLGAQLGVLTKVKEEGEDDEEAKGGDHASTLEQEIKELQEQYNTAAQLFSTAIVQFSTAQTEATAVGINTSATAPTTASEAEPSDHSIAFPTLESALTWLRNTFRREDMEDKLTGDYFGRRQGRSESVQDYALELLKLSSRAGLVTSEEKQTKHFVDGLRPRLKKTLKHFILTEKITVAMSDWEGMVKAAGQLEREHPALKTADQGDYHTNDAVVSSIVAGAPASGSEEEKTEDRAQHTPRTYQFEEFVSAVSALTDVVHATVDEKQGREHNNSDRARRCYNCHEVGHLSWQCPVKPSDQTMQFRARRNAMPRFSPTCYRCNRVGHYSTNCPEAAAGARSQPSNPKFRRGVREGAQGRGREREFGDKPPATYRTQNTQGDRKSGNASRA